MSYTLELMDFPLPSQASLLEGAPIVIWGTVYPIKHSDLHQKTDSINTTWFMMVIIKLHDVPQ
jgi:cytochrome c biogenesis factor